MNMGTKKSFRYLLMGIAVLAAFACSRKFEEITDLPLSRCIKPVNLNAIVNKAVGNEVRFVWDVTSDVKSYNLIVFDTHDEENEYLNVTIDPSEVPYVTEMEPNLQCSFKVQGLREGRDPSNWAVYPGSFKTEAVGVPLYLTITDKTDETVSFSWDKTIADYTNVTHIEYSVVNGAADAEGGIYTLEESDIESATATLTGLKPSTQYDFVLYYSVANRGYVNAWTNPAQGEAEAVSDVARLIELATAGSDIYLLLSNSPYEMETVTPAKGFRIIGEADAEGNRPVIHGQFTLAGALNEETFHFENVDFDGTGTRSNVTEVLKEETEAVTVNVEFVNCGITRYNNSLFYSNKGGGKLTVQNLIFQSCDIHNMGTAGAAVDVRQNASLENVDFTDNTIYDSFGNFLRMDVGAVVGNVTFVNNTVKNVAPSPATKSFFYIRGNGEWTNLTLKDNLFLHEGASSSLFYSSSSTEPKNTPATPGISAQNNWMYETGETFGAVYDAKLTSVDTDPCYNSKGNYFNLAFSEGGNVGASKWWRPYVEKPEDLTLDAVTAPHVWHFDDATLFAGTAKRSMVRDGLLIAASDARPVKFENNVTLTSAAELTKKGVPADSYLAFKVTAPGSVYINLTSATNAGVTIATQPVAGGTIKPVGAAFSASSVQKIIIPSVTDETMVYIYPSGAVTISALEWSSDVSEPNHALSAPTPAIDVTQITQGDETAITVTWDEVVNAASYAVSFNGGAAQKVEETSYVIDAEKAASLAAGSYTVSVTAVPGADDIYHTESAPATVAFAVLSKGGEEQVEVTLTWNFSDSDWVAQLQSNFTTINTNQNDINFTFDGLTVNGGGKSMKYNAVGSTYFIQPGGAGKATERFFSFEAPVSGTLTAYASNTGNSEDLTRLVAVNVGDADVVTKPGGYKSDDGAVAVTFDITVTEPTTVIIYASGNGLRFYGFEFTYVSAAPSVDYVWDFSSSDWVAQLQSNFTTINTNQNDINFTFDGLTVNGGGKSMKYNAVGSTYFIQPGGAGKATERFFSFEAPVSGTLTAYASNTGNSEDLTRLVAVNVGDADVVTKPGGYKSDDGAVAVTFDITVTEPTTVIIYASGNGLRFYGFEFHSN